MPKIKLSKTTVFLIFTVGLFLSLVVIVINLSNIRDFRPQAASTPETNPANVSSTTNCLSTSNIHWTNPTKARFSDNSFASAPNNLSTAGHTYCLFAKEYGFQIPSGSTIDSIDVKVKRKATSEPFSRALDTYIGLVNGNTNISGNLCIDCDNTSVISSSVSTKSLTYSGNVSLSTVNSANFGVKYKARMEGTVTTYVDHISLTVNYMTPDPVPTASISADDTSIAYNTSTTIRWFSTDATSCSVSPPGWTGISGAKPTGNLTSTTKYIVDCTGDGGTASDSVTVNVGSKPPDPDPDPDPDPTPDPPPDGGGGTPLPPPPGGGLPSLPSPPTGIPGVAVPIDPDIVNILKIKLSVPYLLGNITSPLIVGGFVQDLELKPGKSDYEVDVRGAKFALGKTLNIQIGGNKALIKKLKLKTKAPKQPVKFGILYLGDTNRDNKINDGDFLRYLDSIPTQDESSDVNADGVVNSLDWAILMVNFGRIGDR